MTRKFDSMVFYRGWLETARKYLPEAEVAAFAVQIIEYGIDGVAPEYGKGDPRAIMFDMVMPLVDSNAKKRAAGAKGGKGKGALSKSKSALSKTRNALSKSQSASTNENEYADEYENESADENENSSATQNVAATAPAGGGADAAPAEAASVEEQIAAWEAEHGAV